MIDLFLPSMAPMTCVTTVAGTRDSEPRLILDLHTPLDDLRLQACNLQTVAFLRRAIMALHRDALQLLDHDDLHSRVHHLAPAVEPLHLWRSSPPTLP